MLDKTQTVQEMEYEFPYHYLPDDENGNFKWWPYWDWGYRYLTGINTVISKLNELKFDSLLDVGCGDGRFLREVRRVYADKNLLGVDYSPTAIRLANSMNPHLEYMQGDISNMELGHSYDIVTLIEVLEHIPPDQISNFIDALASMVKADGKLLITVPHKNQKIIDKHYQHFDSIGLKKLFEPHFNVEQFFFFDKQSQLVNWCQRLLFNKYYIVRHQGLLNFMYSRYKKNYLNCNESECQRLGMILRLK